ncbi:hypothetical protein BDP55DRAFT_723380 [Colletotrichum godetiae]|uniref:Uncharacterized protein n=1 Tax=Colletotrichum godetiae TaxID=1209918 RepID=A0AAJ0AWQ8_9PEZI|nr:uncharacterized protein BDP55DRAFT_723380 [Colletotrichum godetiae]KAK1699726.1 hypothetical protein BDP55DRAFT_723380 [Colletotrichum godetiae]
MSIRPGESLTVACFIIVTASVNVPGIVAYQGQYRYPHSVLGAYVVVYFSLCPSNFWVKKESSAEMSVPPDDAREEVSEAGEPRWHKGSGHSPAWELAWMPAWTLAWNL